MPTNVHISVLIAGNGGQGLAPSVFHDGRRGEERRDVVDVVAVAVGGHDWHGRRAAWPGNAGAFPMPLGPDDQRSLAGVTSPADVTGRSR